jgi:hypothetical protein
MDQVPRARLAVVLAASAVVLAAVAASLVVAQVEVTHTVADVTRTCGSVFDAVADRSGWEIWWARDLDEPDLEVRSALVRTSGCPDAINDRLALAALFGGVAALAVLGVVVLRADRRRQSRARSDVAERLVRLGRITSLVGAILTLAGLVAVVLLVADADSTLFLYTDRLVVGVVGLIVLVPTASLVVIGRALTILGGDDVRGGIDPVPQDAIEGDPDA